MTNGRPETVFGRRAERRAGSASLLLGQLAWFIRLRWAAAAGVILVGVLAAWIQWPGSRPGSMLTLGTFLLAYNVAMLLLVRADAVAQRQRLHVLAWAQVCVDLACLTLLTLWTGDLASPVVGFYVFHMIFASLLLPRATAYACAVVGIVMLATGLLLSGRWPAAGSERQIVFLGWVMTLVLTVHLANHITRALRRQRRRLLRQNREIRRIGRQLSLQQDTIIAQEKMAALGQMAAGITHEIANPLASMDSLLQLMQRRPERADSRSLETLRTQVARINEIVRQMTTFAHPGDGAWETTPVNGLVDSALDMLRFDPRFKAVQVDRQLDPAAGAAKVIPQAMQQVLVNLITNALDAMAETAAPRLIVKTEPAGEWCTIKVTDNGHGIRQEHLSRVFEPFFTTKPVGKGTGVGLSISYRLVRKQHGEIGVTSTTGEGTTFMIRLPALVS
jgi:signal transduction histidine kinase